VPFLFLSEDIIFYLLLYMVVELGLSVSERTQAEGVCKHDAWCKYEWRWRKLHDKEVNDLYSLLHIIRMIKSRGVS